MKAIINRRNFGSYVAITNGKCVILRAWVKDGSEAKIEYVKWSISLNELEEAINYLKHEC